MKTLKPPLSFVKTRSSTILASVLTLFIAACSPEATSPSSNPTVSTPNTIKDVLSHQHREQGHVERDKYRNPAATLAFFGITADMDVIEINPGRGYYLEILAPFVSGKYIVAGNYDLEAENNYVRRSTKVLYDKLESSQIYKDVGIAHFDTSTLDVAKNSADAVLTFRNIHSFAGDGAAKRSFKLFFDALKPGGVLGVVQHRSADVPENAYLDSLPATELEKTGYMPEDYVISLAESEGFALEASSEINANTLDSGNHPKGVWTLPPSLSLGDENKDEYVRIGESDRMTLRFRKPEV